MDSTEIPHVIDEYQRAHDRHDTEAALGAFGPGATVVDEDITHSGIGQIREWLTRSSNLYTYTRTHTGTDDLGDDTYLVRNHLSGDFPGNEVDLQYRFRLRNGLIDRLEIAP